MGAAFVTSLMSPFNLALLHAKLDDDLAALQATSMPTTLLHEKSTTMRMGTGNNVHYIYNDT